jgi:hypothetical protein
MDIVAVGVSLILHNIDYTKYVGKTEEVLFFLCGHYIYSLVINLICATPIEI